MMSRSRWVMLAAALGAAVATTLIVVAAGRTGSVPAVAILQRYGGSENQCQSRVTQAAFAIDYVILRSRSATATVTRVDLVGVRGDLHIAHVALVPFTTGGTGFKWGDPVFAHGPSMVAAAAAARPSALVRQMAGVPAEGERTPWQLLVDVHTTTGGSAHHVVVTYTNGGRTWHLTGEDLVGVQPTRQMCDAVLRSATP